MTETDRLRVLPLDVTSPESIVSLFESAGPIDVLVNNAGIGGVGAFEAMPMSLIRQLVETNTIGVMAMCQAVIPQMRERQSGTIINVTSSVTLGEFPLAAAYTATKQAIEGFSASLAHELAYFGVRVKLVEPGYAPTTRFGANAIVFAKLLLPTFPLVQLLAKAAYCNIPGCRRLAEPIRSGFQEEGESCSNDRAAFLRQLTP